MSPSNHINIPENVMGTDYIIGDLHGCRDMFDAALYEIGFCPDKDRIFSVGDLVDRGNKNLECVALLNEPWFFSVRGNHEQMAIDFVDGLSDCDIYRYNGGQWFIDLSPTEQQKYADKFRRMPIMMTIGGKYGIVHADVPCDDWLAAVDSISTPDSIVNMRTIQNCIWSRSRIFNADESIIKNIEKVFCGHTPVKTPLTLGNVRYIDTGCVYGHSLTIESLDGIPTYTIPVMG